MPGTAPSQSPNSKSRASEEKRRLERKSKQATGLTPVKIYLLLYNTAAAVLWAHLLYLLLSFLYTSFVSSALVTPRRPETVLKKLLNQSTRIYLPKVVDDFTTRLSGSYDYKNLGWWTKVTQSLAVLEIVHSATGIVRSPFLTTAMQVASRLWTVWGIVEPVPETHSNPLFTTMLFAWSVTEVIRYSFYALSILNIDVGAINWLRFTTFLPLYPLGASSEAFLSFSTLPPLSTLPYIPDWLSTLSPLSSLIRYLPEGWGRYLMKSRIGRAVIWNLAKAGLKGKKVAAGGVKAWGPIELLRLFLFVAWWPALYVLYVHMLVLRKRYFSKGRTVGHKTKTL
ncbi:tyrosine phosphatase-like protein [Naematelia encephala]|uniref:Very-long-chain (3R)-3-hydroxyacyl-CoA dehydratase n=1 Tax=Naematelia encephala TaxID=71784 RepID=A0A1Y2BJS6_9TREE|nr:tyrosine phosphatase-like protein [Naematelia encephala]